MKKCAGLPSVAVMGLAVLACSAEDTGTANHDAGASDGATGGTGGTTVSASCTAYEQTTDLHASCELVRENCPRTVYDYLEGIAVDGELPWREVLEGDGLEEIGDEPIRLGGARFSFTKADGMLAGWHAWDGELPFGPCASSRESAYQRGRLLSPEGGWASTHRCDLAPDALGTGVLCDCPCPDPPPSNGVHEGSFGCLALLRQECAATFAEQRRLATPGDGLMRFGCGVRTITVDSVDCSYDEAGALLGGLRARNGWAPAECPGVDAYVWGDAPATCAEESTCYIGSSPPEGSMPCPP